MYITYCTSATENSRPPLRSPISRALNLVSAPGPSTTSLCLTISFSLLPVYPHETCSLAVLWQVSYAHTQNLSESIRSLYFAELRVALPLPNAVPTLFPILTPNNQPFRIVCVALKVTRLSACIHRHRHASTHT